MVCTLRILIPNPSSAYVLGFLVGLVALQVYEQVEARAGFVAEANAVYERGVLARISKENEAPQKDKGPAAVVDPSSTRGTGYDNGLNTQLVRDWTTLWYRR